CASRVVHADETVWRCDGRGGYAWVFLGKDGVLLLCRTTRSGQRWTGSRPTRRPTS
ncbi:MAG: transposase, partial [Kiritimatiellae bacterium]|nr:transposase [Kiritimatiellia bacterium]MBR1836127.1 transposase [Kiritimatiellia bacterium]